MKIIIIGMIVIDILYLIWFNIQNFKYFKNKPNNLKIISGYVQGEKFKSPLSNKECIFWALYKEENNKSILIKTSENNVYLQNIDDFSCTQIDKNLSLKLCKNNYKKGDIKEFIILPGQFVKTSYDYNEEKNIMTLSKQEEPSINKEEKINIINLISFVFIVILIFIFKAL